MNGSKPSGILTSSVHTTWTFAKNTVQKQKDEVNRVITTKAMKLPKHKLPKQVHKKIKTAKHKDSERHQEKRQKIIDKRNNEGMTIDDKAVDTR